VIGPEHRVAGALPRELERTLMRTVVGQADYADPDTSNVCRDCLWWLRGKTRALGSCGLYQRRMGGNPGPKLANTTRACRAFEKQP
jgi:hypothetical protein